jgi:hypothetical protein
MTTYTVTPVSTKQPGTWTSPTVQVTENEGYKSRLWLRGDGLQNEPDTTTLEWAIQMSDDGQTWRDQGRITPRGNNGQPFFKPVILSTTIDDLIGKYIRTVATTNASFRFGIDLEVF